MARAPGPLSFDPSLSNPASPALDAPALDADVLSLGGRVVHRGE
ncbi:hypothetical protein J2847_005216 [Azospirillum agricola]|nr:hypothetical protein [Azospirillum agricola]